MQDQLNTERTLTMRNKQVLLRDQNEFFQAMRTKRLSSHFLILTQIKVSCHDPKEITIVKKVFAMHQFEVFLGDSSLGVFLAPAHSKPWNQISILRRIAQEAPRSSSVF